MRLGYIEEHKVLVEVVEVPSILLVEVVGKNKPSAPLGNPEPVAKGDDRDSALREMLTGMKGE